MRRALAVTILASASLGACHAPTLDGMTIGLRRGEQEAIDRVDTVEAGSRKDLAATVDVGPGAGWVVATWTVWPERGVPRVVKSKMFNTTAPKKLFADLEGDTEGGWKEGTITCDFKTGSGHTAAGKIRVVAKR